MMAGLRCINVANFSKGLTSSLHRQKLFMSLDVESQSKTVPGLYLKQDAIDIFKSGIKSAQPQHMLANILKHTPGSSTLKVNDQYYELNRNVFVVGMGSATLGMAKVVEDLLGKHIVKGIISIPHGIKEDIEQTGDSGMIEWLQSKSNIEVHEGTCKNVDKVSVNASKAIKNLVGRLSHKDLLIVLISGGGSLACPLPCPPITWQELGTMHALLGRHGATMLELNTVLQNLEILKGGGLAREAQPAKVCSLILSSLIGDPVSLIASGPTSLTEPTPNFSLRILERLKLMHLIPESVKTHLEKEAKKQQMEQTFQIKRAAVTSSMPDPMRKNIQNVIVGNNNLALEGASHKASKLGYYPIVLPTVFEGDGKDVGVLFARLAKFIMMCLNRSPMPNSEIAILEVDLVSKGVNKKLINELVTLVEKADNIGKDICVIASSDLTIQVKGKGVGGKNMESVVSAAIQMNKDFRENEMSVPVSDMSLLCADTVGTDGCTDMAGAVVDLHFLDSIEKRGLDLNAYLENNDTFTLLNEMSEGNLLKTNKTGTDVMDMIVLIVQRPSEIKYQHKH